MKNKTKMFFSVIVASLLALGTPVLAENVTGDAQVGNVAPTVDWTQSPEIVLFENNTITYEFAYQYSDDNGVSDFDDSFTRFICGGDVMNEATDGVTVTQVNNTTEKMNVSLLFNYYESPGTFSCTYDVQDSSGASDSVVNDTTINSLIASGVSVDSVDFGDDILPGSYAETSSFKVENYGNVKLNSSWNGTDMTGAGTIPISNIEIEGKVLSHTPQFVSDLEVWSMVTDPYNLDIVSEDTSGSSKVSNIQDIVWDSGNWAMVLGSSDISWVGTSGYDVSSGFDSPTENVYALSISDARSFYVGPSNTYILYKNSTGSFVGKYNISMSDMSWDGAVEVDSYQVSEVTSPSGLEFGNSGNKMYVVGNDSSDQAYVYDLSSAYDLGTVSFDGAYGEPAGREDVEFGPNGENLLFYRSNDKAYQWSLSTPWDISGSSTGPTESKGGAMSGTNGIDITNSGENYFTVSDTTLKGYTFYGVNPSRKYEPDFTIPTVPTPLPAGSYSNIFEHTATQA